MFNTPILFLIFNRPDTTQQVFNQIKAIKPKFLYVAADGPRKDKEGEKELCEETRKIIDQVDWDCEVVTRYQDKNLGCGLHVSGAITWFFEQVEQGIILEDDCLPDLSFFSFCEELLEHYKDDDSVFMINGNNFVGPKIRSSYYFSAYGHIWGWATWRRAWNVYTFNVDYIDPNKLEQKLNDYFKSKEQVHYWLSIYSKMLNNEIDTWDYQWHLAIYYNSGKFISPKVNLVSNIGFNEQATHTSQELEGVSNLPTLSISSIKHNINKTIQKQIDYRIFTETNLLKKNITYSLRDKLYLFREKILNQITKL